MEIEHTFDSAIASSEVVEIGLTAVEYAGDEELADVADATLTRQFELLRRVIDQLEFQAARRLAEIDRRQAYAGDGYTSTTAYLKHRCRITAGRAKRQVGDARALSTMERTRQLAEDGRLSQDQVRRLIAVRESQPDHFDGHEATLCDVAEGLEWVADLDKALAYWQQAVSDPPADISLEDQRGQAHAHAFHTFGGMVRIDALVDAEQGAQVIETLREATPPPPGPDEPPASLANRQAQALVDLILGNRDTATRPAVVVHVDAETLAKQHHTLAEVGDQVVTPGHVERVTCDASIRRVVFGPSSEVIDVGRARRLVTEPMRQAIVARDRHCRFPGCDRPARWCDTHHIVHWSQGGRTAVDSCILLCRRHHSLVHEGWFTVEGAGHAPVFRRRDGTVLGRIHLLDTG